MTAMKTTTDVSDREIAVRAYERWMRRGCPITDGNDDWFAARLELESNASAAAKPKTTKAKAPRRASASKQAQPSVQ